MNEAYSFVYPDADPFYKELQQDVKYYFSRKGESVKANSAMWARVAFMLCGLVSVYLVILSGILSKPSSLLCCFLLGFFVAGTGCNVAHDALHGTLSKKKWVNQCFGFSMDLLGSNSYLWKINHNNHHRFTNIAGLDGDIRENALIRFSPLHPDKKAYRFQLLSLFFVYGSFLLLTVYSFNFIHMFRRKPQPNMPARHPAKEIIRLVIFKSLYVFVWIIIPLGLMPVTAGEFILGYLCMNFTAGYLLAFNFMAPHNFEETLYKGMHNDQPESWAAHQLHTTANFRTRNKLLQFFIGGLNYQIEHHLFPQICSIHYPGISGIVKKAALRHGLPYYEKQSFWQIITSHFKRLKSNTAFENSGVGYEN